MVDIVLDSAELTVLGGPSKLSVQVDLGQQGNRGSIFVVGNGDPNSITQNNIVNGVNVAAYDMYINTLQGKDYSKLYQYIVGDGGVLTWVPVLTLLPNIYSINKILTFTNGSTTISDINLSDIIDIGTISSLTAANFNIQHSFVGSNTIASSISVGTPANGKLPITIHASEFDGTSWNAVTGSKTVHILITVV